MMANLPDVGSFLSEHGGWLGGYISVSADGVATHGLIVADKSTEFTSRYGAGEGRDSTSPIDGPSNFAKMLAAGDDAATGIQSGLNDTNHAGFNDWYLPARMELYAIYWELKPTAIDNETDTNTNPDNPWAVPQRDPKTLSDPSQTNIVQFRESGAQVFESEATGENSRYWSSTEASGLSSFYQRFRRGETTNVSKQDVWKVRAVRRVPVEDLIEDPPTEEEVFRASFEDASGRDPLPTALLNRTPARQLAAHNVLVYRYPPYTAIKRVPIRLEDYPLTMPGMMIWHQDDRDPLFKMGRWAQIQGRRFGDNPLEVELTLRISDHPQSFEAPQ